ncbi:MAG: hypothetical protein ACKOX3_08895 [Bacteroidota bacterium]
MHCKNTFIPIKALLFCCIFLQTFISFPLNAQGYYRPHPFLSPMWQIESEYIPATQIGDTSMSNGYAGANFSMRIPIWKKKDWLDASGGKPFMALLTHYGASARRTQTDLFQPNQNLTVSKFGLTALMAKGLRNLYLMQGFASMPTTDFSVQLNHIRFHGTALWRHLYHNNRWWHTLGLTYSPVFSKDLLLPIVGAGVQLSNENQLQCTFPFNLTYTHLFSKKLSVSLKINNAGGYNYFKSDSIHAGNWNLYRFNYKRASVMLRYYTDRFVVFTLEGGATDWADLHVNETYYQQHPSFYVRIGFQIRFGSRPPAAPILNFDPGESGFDPNYLVE